MLMSGDVCVGWLGSAGRARLGILAVATLMALVLTTLGCGGGRNASGSHDGSISSGPDGSVGTAVDGAVTGPCREIAGSSFSSVFDSSRVRIAVRERLVSGQDVFTRTSTDAQGDTWPDTWQQSTVLATWGLDVMQIVAIDERALLSPEGTDPDVTGVLWKHLQEIHADGQIHTRTSPGRDDATWESWRAADYTSLWPANGTEPLRDRVEAAYTHAFMDADGYYTGAEKVLFTTGAVYIKRATDWTGNAWPVRSAREENWRTETGGTLTRADAVRARSRYDSVGVAIRSEREFLVNGSIWRQRSDDVAGTMWGDMEQQSYVDAFGLDPTGPCAP